MLAAYALGLPAYVLVKVLVPGFFARKDTRTPVKIAIVCLVANIVLILILIWPLAQVGIALATALAAWLNAGLLGFRLHREGFLRPDARLRRRLPRIALVSLADGCGALAAAALAGAAAAEPGAGRADRARRRRLRACWRSCPAPWRLASSRRRMRQALAPALTARRPSR